MKQHTIELKLEVVKKYMTGLAGYKSLGQEYGIGFGLVRRWVLFYKYHGFDGLKSKKPVQYSADAKLAVLQDMWKHKLSYAEVAAKFNIRSQCCVAVWERLFREGGIVPLIPKPIGRVRPMPAPTDKDARSSAPPLTSTSTTTPATALNDETRSRAELVAELNHLRMEVAYLKKLRALVLADQQAAQTLKKRKPFES